MKLKPIYIDIIDLIPGNTDTTALVVSGWTSSLKADENNLKVSQNGKEVPVVIENIPRPDTMDVFEGGDFWKNNGFRLRAEIPNGNLNGIEIQFQNKTIKKIQNDEVTELLQKPFYWTIESAQSAPGLMTIGGWIYSGFESDFQFRILDENGNEISDATIMRKERPDVMEAFLTEEGRGEGFNINVFSDDYKEFTLEIIQDSNKQSIPLKDLKVKRHSVLWPITPERIGKGFKYLYKKGPIALYKRIFKQNEAVDPFKQSVHLSSYYLWYFTQQADKDTLKKQRKTKFEYEPKISLIVAAYNTPINFFQDMIDSVKSQTYPNWELCIADGSDNDSLEEYIKNEKDKRIKYRKLEKNAGISANMNAAAELATGDYITLFDHDDFIEPDALFETVKAINETHAPVIYTDEDKYSQEKGIYCDPNLKPDFSPDLLLSTNYICHMLTISREAWEKAGPLHSEFDGAQDYDLVLRLMDLYKPEQIVHVAKPVYHWRMHMNSTAMNAGSKTWAFDAGKRALEAWMERNDIEGTVSNTKYPGYYELRRKILNNPKVSILIPNKDHTGDLDKAIRSFEKNSTYRNFEIIVIENNSTEEKTRQYYDKIQKEFSNVKVVVWDGPFNYSAINNFGAKYATGDYFLLLNNDTELISPDLLESMLSYAQREDVGAVGAKLLFFDDTIQHNGVVAGLGGIAGHVFSTEPDDASSYLKFTASDVSIVTAACLLVSRKVFEEVGGLNEDLQVAFNDVDFCLKIRKAGYLIVQDSFVKMHHYESKSRGSEDNPQKRSRFENEERYMIREWSDVLYKEDPFYNKNWTLGNGFHFLRSPAEQRPIELLEEYLDQSQYR